MLNKNNAPYKSKIKLKGKLGSEIYQRKLISTLEASNFGPYENLGLLFQKDLLSSKNVLET